MLRILGMDLGENFPGPEALKKQGQKFAERFAIKIR